ncbi:MAG: hypothetical protein V2B15_17655 [Bacteroidota bacterium]
MHRILLWVSLLILTGACTQSGQKEGDSRSEKAEKIITATIQELVANPEEYKDKNVAITGMVTHVCRHGGQKCFVLAEDGETQIRVVPSGGIDEFNIALEGSTVAFTGTFKVMEPEQAEAHVADHEAQAQHETEMAHSTAEKADIFIEAVDFKEITR